MNTQRRLWFCLLSTISIYSEVEGPFDVDRDPLKTDPSKTDLPLVPYTPKPVQSGDQINSIKKPVDSTLAKPVTGGVHVDNGSTNAGPLNGVKIEQQPVPTAPESTQPVLTSGKTPAEQQALTRLKEKLDPLMQQLDTKGLGGLRARLVNFFGGKAAEAQLYENAVVNDLQARRILIQNLLATSQTRSLTTEEIAQLRMAFNAINHQEQAFQQLKDYSKTKSASAAFLSNFKKAMPTIEEVLGLAVDDMQEHVYLTVDLADPATVEAYQDFRSQNVSLLTGSEDLAGFIKTAQGDNLAFAEKVNADQQYVRALLEKVSGRILVADVPTLMEGMFRNRVVFNAQSALVIKQYVQQLQATIHNLSFTDVLTLYKQTLSQSGASPFKNLALYCCQKEIAQVAPQVTDALGQLFNSDLTKQDFVERYGELSDLHSALYDIRKAPSVSPSLAQPISDMLLLMEQVNPEGTIRYNFYDIVNALKGDNTVNFASFGGAESALWSLNYKYAEALNDLYAYFKNKPLPQVYDKGLLTYAQKCNEFARAMLLELDKPVTSDNKLIKATIEEIKPLWKKFVADVQEKLLPLLEAQQNPSDILLQAIDSLQKMLNDLPKDQKPPIPFTVASGSALQKAMFGLQAPGGAQAFAAVAKSIIQQCEDGMRTLAGKNSLTVAQMQDLFQYVDVLNQLKQYGQRFAYAADNAPTTIAKHTYQDAVTGFSGPLQDTLSFVEETVIPRFTTWREQLQTKSDALPLGKLQEAFETLVNPFDVFFDAQDESQQQPSESAMKIALDKVATLYLGIQSAQGDKPFVQAVQDVTDMTVINVGDFLDKATTVPTLQDLALLGQYGSALYEVKKYVQSLPQLAKTGDMAVKARFRTTYNQAQPDLDKAVAFFKTSVKAKLQVWQKSATGDTQTMVQELIKAIDSL